MASESEYVMMRGVYPSIRLNIQHYLWRDGLGYLIHPSIPLTGTDLKIADLGTGTAIWLLDLAQQVPESVQLHCFDISNSQYPHPKDLPPNVHLSLLDSLNTDPPENLQGIFDVVHLRLLLGVVPNGDPTNILTHALKLLRPGGYIQWDEFDPLRSVAGGPKGESSLHVERALKFLSGALDHRWIEHLPQIFAKFKLQDIESVFEFEKLWQRKMTSEIVCSTIDEMRQNGSRGIEERLKALGVSVPMMCSEVMRGAYLSQPFCVVIGRKPLNEKGEEFNGVL